MGIIPIRPLLIEGDVARVPLSQGLFALIDSADADLVGKYNWCVRQGKWGPYAMRAKKIGGIKHYIYLHRFIMRPADGLMVDHKNRDGLDNRRCNLRICTASQNNGNKTIQKNNTSGFKGVTWSKANRRWVAQIVVNKKNIYLGSSANAEIAAELYRKAAAEFHGEFARFE